MHYLTRECAWAARVDLVGGRTVLSCSVREGCTISAEGFFRPLQVLASWDAVLGAAGTMNIRLTEVHCVRSCLVLSFTCTLRYPQRMLSRSC